MNGLQVFKNYIDGKFVQAKSKNTFQSLNPANKRVLAHFQDSDRRDIDEAVKSAKKSFRSWSEVPAPKRGEILFEVSRILRKRKQELGRLVTQEMGKVLKEGLGDVQEAIDTFEYFGGEGRRLFGNTTPSELKDKMCFTVRRPFGVAGLITPWNFPIAVPSWKLAPALVCGNTVVFKPASDAPLCAYRLLEILIEAGVPKGVVNFVTGSGENAGSPLAKNPDVRVLSFTGSKTVGEFITQIAGIKKIGLELGGKNAIIVMDDADLDLAVDGILWGAFGTTGQRCTATSRVIVHKKIKSELENMLVKRASKLKIGDGLKSATDVGPLINKSALSKVSFNVDLARKQKARLLLGGEPGSSKGFFYKPTIFTDVTSKMDIAKKEIFGPVLSIMKANDFNDAIKICNDIEYGLSSAIYTKNISYALKAVSQIDSGITYINSSTIGAEVHLPFGGTKHTGNGTREAGWTGIGEFSEEKTVYIDYSGRLQKAQGID